MTEQQHEELLREAEADLRNYRRTGQKEHLQFAMRALQELAQKAEVS